MADVLEGDDRGRVLSLVRLPPVGRAPVGRTRAAAAFGRVASGALFGRIVALRKAGDAFGQVVFANADGNVDAFVAQPAGKLACEGHLEVQVGEPLGSGEHVGGGAVERNASAVEHDDAVGLGRLFHEVGDAHDGHAALVERLADAHEPTAAARVEHGRRLVEHEDFRLHGERACDGDALFLAARKRIGFVRFEPDEADLAKRLAHASCDFGGFDAEVFRAECNVVFDEGGHQLVVGVLEHHAGGGADGVKRAFVGGVHGVDAHASLIGDEQGVDMFGEGGLSRPVAAEDADEFPRGDADGYVAEHEMLVVVGKAEMFAIDHRVPFLLEVFRK